MHDSAAMIEKTKAFIEGRRRPLSSTYRLQFHAGFTFHDAERITPYLRELGISHAYASPYLKARKGSAHGYDIVDHGSLNPEVGDENDFNSWIRALQDAGLAHIFDMVPNHMGVGTNENPWWNDVLENGPASRFGAYFDIAWRGSHRSELEDKVLLPALGEPYGEVLEAGQLSLRFENGAFSIRYFERYFPVTPCSYAKILGHNVQQLEAKLGPENASLLEYESVLTACRNLPNCSENDPVRILERSREKEVIKRRLSALAAESAEVRDFIGRNLAAFNGEPGSASSFDLLDSLMESQTYRLSYWRVASDEINYRRFFDINDLAAISVEREDVFAASHSFVLKLLADGRVDGLRIDHPDGLYDPQQYFARLQRAFAVQCARKSAESEAVEWKEIEEPTTAEIDAQLASGWKPLYVVAEKILGEKEALPESWAVDGTSGYEFLATTNGLFVDSDAEGAFTRLYVEWLNEPTSYSALIYEKKRLVLQASLSSELHMLADQLDRLAQKSRRSRDFTFNTLRKGLREVIACFPVYRSYIAGDGVSDVDRRHVELAVRRARVRNPLMNQRVFLFIRGMLLLEYPDSFSEADRAEQLRFAGKFQQVTAPVTAKGVEDTSFYNFNRLISLNEVGGEPDRFAVSVEALHQFYTQRQAKWPSALSPLSTHDTKRSEDIRARINVLSEIPEEFEAGLRRWREQNTPFRRTIDEQVVPDPNEEYLFYQTLIGAWPLGESTGEHWLNFVNRIQDYMEKAIHEAKVHTSWINPNAEYDAAVREFAANVLDWDANGAFLNDFRAFQAKTSRHGMINSLSQSLLKLTAPGVPDTYQGTELWDFSLVDPDNRRPVDYELRERMLKELSEAGDRQELCRQLTESMEDGRIKLLVTSAVLKLRREQSELFLNGRYVPLEATGLQAKHIFAFAREIEGRAIVVAVPRLTTKLVDGWRETELVLPHGGPWKNVLTDQTLEGQRFSAVSLFDGFPVCLLISQE